MDRSSSGGRYGSVFIVVVVVVVLFIVKVEEEGQDAGDRGSVVSSGRTLMFSIIMTLLSTSRIDAANFKDALSSFSASVPISVSCPCACPCACVCPTLDARPSASEGPLESVDSVESEVLVVVSIAMFKAVVLDMTIAIVEL